jgi:hypothetical protein
MQPTIPTASVGSPVSARTAAVTVRDATRARSPVLSVRIGGHLFGTLEPSSRDVFALVWSRVSRAEVAFARDPRGFIISFAFKSSGTRSHEFERKDSGLKAAQTHP